MKKRTLVFICLVCLLAISACSINKMAINAVSNALTGEGSSEVFTGDSDPALVGEALPFAIKMFEALLSQNPKHDGLILMTGSLFVMYANAFVQGPAEMLPPEEYEAHSEGKARAKKLYLRGAELLYSGLEKKYPGFSKAKADDGTLDAILKKCKKADVGLLYWAVAGSLAAYSVDVFDFELADSIPEWSAMIKRAYELNPNHDGAAIDEFFIQFYGSLPSSLGGDMELAKSHFQKAIEKTKNTSVGAYVSYVQSVCLPERDYDGFKENLEKALAIDVNANKSTRLVNIINQRKAQHLMDTAYNFFSFLPGPYDYDEW